MTAIKEEYSPSEYFVMVKDKKNKSSDQMLNRVYDNCLNLLNKYKVTGQTSAAKKMIFHLETIEKEREIIKSGINTFVYKDDIEEFIENVANDVVKIIELEKYEREVPDEVIQDFEKVKHLFDQCYVVFTDYTGKIEKQIEKERDPILFGTFQDKDSRTVVDRFYFIGDWEDEYCDLTLDKMVNQMKKSKNTNIEMTINTPEDIDNFKEQLSKLEPKGNRFVVNNNQAEKKKGLIGKVKTFLSKK
ncbi:hypothetical protein [Oceanobacillus oncorhynchi]|uniref:hypothetical protein n=1 Tax=Oceanobacillus oncorhynchi TaxID=545501 RepID=UPI0034D61FB9